MKKSMMKQAWAWAAMVTVVILNAMAADGQGTAETKAAATPPNSVGAAAVADGLAKWKLLPVSDDGSIFSKPKKAITGEALSSYAYSLDPSGIRMAFFFMYGPGGMSTDGGLNWTPFTSVQPRDFDCGVVDWEDTGKTCLALCHESKPPGKLVLSSDSGITWKELGTGFTGPVGLFDAKTLIVGSKGGVMQRSTDGGATWAKIDSAPKMNLGIQSVVVFKGAGYIVSSEGLLVSKDKGVTWTLCGSLVNISGTQKFRPQGLFFGADEKHIVLVGWDGVFQTVDGGAHWSKVASLPEEFPNSTGKGSGSNHFTWDPVHNIVYGCSRWVPAMYCQLPPPAKH